MSITLNDFVSKYTGKGIDWDGHYGFQCTDLYRQYVQEVLNFPQSPGVQGAKDIWDSYLIDYYDRIPNTPEGVPQAGDVMIWGSKYGPYGHVAIVLSANTSSFTCFSQNDPAGSLCVKKKYTAWSALLGWLRPKQKSSIYRGYDLNNSDSMKICVDKIVEIMEGKYISIDEHNKVINELDAKSTAMAQDYGKDKQILEEKIRTLEGIITKLQETEHSWSDTADVLERKLSAVIGELQKSGLSISTENNVTDLASSVSVYISNFKDGSKDVLDLSDRLEKANKEILKLKSKETAFRTVNIGSIIIKFYKVEK